MCACHKDDPVSPPAEEQEAERTVIVYMMAENSLTVFANEDSTEMASAVNLIPKDYNLVLYNDDNKKPTITSMNAERGINLWKKFKQDQNSTDSTVMLSTLQEIVKAFPSKHYALVLWSHGSGWMPQKKKTIGIDNNRNTYSNSGTEMEIHSLRWVLEQLPHMDYIFFDACFMQSVEVAYELRNVTDYTVGSPAEIPGAGAPYHQIMEGLVSANVQQIGQNYFKHYEDIQKQYEEGVQRNNPGGVALSVIDCKQLEHLAEKTAAVLPLIWQEANDIQTYDIQTYVTRTNSEKPEIHDLQSAMYQLLPQEQYEDWSQALDKAVIWKKSTEYWSTVYTWSGKHFLTDPEHYGGVSMFIPHSRYTNYGWNADFQQTSWHRDAGWKQTGW